MLKKKILVRKVYNLTDARYFSAMNVDWISFDLSGTNPELLVKHYAEIMSWIEGPTFLMEVGNANAEELLKLLPNISGAINMDGQILNNEDSFQEFSLIFLDNYLYAEKLVVPSSNNGYIVKPNKPFGDFSTSEKSLLEERGVDFPYLLDISAEPTVNTDILKLPGLQGIVFHGGDEEKTGVKSYELIDEWFEEILEEEG